MNRDGLILHRTRCEGCDFCQNRAEERAADEPLDAGEESRRADQYERYFRHL